MINYRTINSIHPRGEHLIRCEMLAKRLESDIYRMPSVYENGNDWPGDWCGRTILAQTMLYDCLDGKSPYLSETVAALPSMLNEKGFLGECGDYIDEQQLSGHSWLLRGLCEYYKRNNDSGILTIISGIVNNLYLPTAGHYGEYHTVSTDSGKYSGNISMTSGSWKYSTDTGCAFISLDGLSAVYEIILPHSDESPVSSAELKKLLDIMTDKFRSFDVSELRLQTHATLTAVRGLLRLYKISSDTGSPDNGLLEMSIRLFDEYLSKGMSSAYGNYNWFRRPEWTEPCAMIDSFIVAVQLFVCTGNSGYLNIASKIKSAVYHAQRSNGGFGCDTCVGAVTDDGITDKLAVRAYEAYWCCTMRGGEGLARIAEYSYLMSGNTLVIPYLSDSEAEIDGAMISQTNTRGSVHLSITGNRSISTVRIYTHGWMNNIRVSGCHCKITSDTVELEIKIGDNLISIDYDSSLFAEKSCGVGNDKESVIIFDMDSILGSLEDITASADEVMEKAEYSEDKLGARYTADGMILRRIDDSYLLGDGDKDASYRLLFR